MLRITATMLEAYRRYLSNEYASFEDMVATVKGGVEPSPAMLLGTAYHEALEWYVCDFVDTAAYPTKVFSGHQIDIANLCDHHKWLDFQWHREIEARRHVSTVPGLTLKCKADAVAGVTVIDHKVTTKLITDAMLQRYQDSMQWRAYLHAFNCSQFMYNVLQVEEEAGVWRIKSQEVIYTSDYEGMGAEVENMARDLYTFCQVNGLTDYLNKPEVADAAK